MYKTHEHERKPTVLSENVNASTTTPSKRKKKPINFYDPFQRVDPKLLEQMYRAAQKEKLKQQPEALM
jgi:hypothetical protein